MRKNLFFLFLLLIVSIYFNYPEILTKRPQSVHAWRQADCASIALNYAEGGMHFFRPEVHNLTSDNGSTGKAATSEVPFLYYLTAVFYQIFGYHEFIFRLLNTLIFLTGLFFLFRLGLEEFGDFFWASFIPLLLFSSPVIAYYANNYLSNTPALGVVLISWYFFFRYLKEPKRKWLISSLIFFFIAASLKITALLSLLSLSGIFILEKLFKVHFRKRGNIFREPAWFVSLTIAAILLVSAWIVYASIYNRIHDCTYFSTVTFPLWALDRQGVSEVLETVRKMWINQYYHYSVYFLLAAMLLFILARLKKTGRFFTWNLLFLSGGIIIYIILQFRTFKDHDYYTINLFILPVFIVLTFLNCLRSLYPRVFSSLILKAFMLIFLLFNIFHTHKKLRERYEGFYMESTYAIEDFYTISPYLREIGIEARDTVISIAGNSHVTLYLMNLRGWTEHIDARFGRGTEIIYDRDSAGIARSIEKGAEYMMVKDISQLYSKPYLKSFASHLKGRYGDVLIFDLKNRLKNFELSSPDLEYTITCDAETLSSDGRFFTGNDDSLYFEYGNLRTNKVSRSGDYSVALNESAPFGMTIWLSPASYGESYQFSVWKKSPSGKGTFVISAENPEDFYFSGAEETDEKEDGWVKIQAELIITPKNEGKKLKFYLYNPSGDTAYFDDLTIKKFSGILKLKEPHETL